MSTTTKRRWRLRGGPDPAPEPAPVEPPSPPFTDRTHGGQDIDHLSGHGRWNIMHGGEHNTVIIDAGTGQGICTGLTLEQARILVGVHNQQLAVSVVRDGHDPNTHINRCDVNILNEHADHHAFNGEVMQRIVINRVVEIVVRGNGTPQDILRKAANQLNDPGSNTTFSVRNS